MKTLKTLALLATCMIAIACIAGGPPLAVKASIAEKKDDKIEPKTVTFQAVQTDEKNVIVFDNDRAIDSTRNYDWLASDTFKEFRKRGGRIVIVIAPPASAAAKADKDEKADRAAKSLCKCGCADGKDCTCLVCPDDDPVAEEDEEEPAVKRLPAGPEKDPAESQSCCGGKPVKKAAKVVGKVVHRFRHVAAGVRERLFQGRVRGFFHRFR